MKVTASSGKAAKAQSKSISKLAASKGNNKLSLENGVAAAVSSLKPKKSVTIVNREDMTKEDDDNDGGSNQIKEELQSIENTSITVALGASSSSVPSNKRKRSTAASNISSVGVPTAPAVMEGSDSASNDASVAEMEISKSPSELPVHQTMVSGSTSLPETSFLDNIDNSKPVNGLFTFVPPTSIPFRGRSNTYTCLPTASESENLEMLRIGTKVVIKGTDIVMHKVPHLVGRIGVIAAVPVHPTTWFKVKFDDNTVVPFRSSGLHVFGSANSAPITHSHPLFKLAGSSSSGGTKLGKKTSGGNSSTASLSSQASRQSGSSSSSKRKTPGSNDSGSNSSKNALLSSTDPDTWVGRSVIILEGKLKGCAGLVLRSGNGWVQVDSRGEEVPKRAYELELVGEGSRRDSSGETQDILNPVKLQRCSSVIPTAAGSDEGGSALIRTRGRPRSYSDSAIPSTKALFMALKNGDEKAESSPNPEPEVRRDPKISLALRQMKFDATQKYVDRHVEVIKGRPDLGYWATQINGTLLNREHEKKVSRPFLAEYCETCNVEFWPGSRFCWNELCSASSIYWRLEGARGAPPAMSVSDSYNKYYGGVKDHTIQYQIRTNKPYTCTFTGVNNYDYSAISNAYISSVNYSVNDVAVPQCEKSIITVDTLQPSGLHVSHATAPKLNIISEYLLSLPSQIVGRDRREINVETVATESSSIDGK